MGSADLSNILQLRNVGLCVSFRSEEILNIKMNHILVHEWNMVIKVEKSRTDQLGQGDEVVIAKSRDSVYPVSLLKAYLGRLNFDPHSSEFIFRPLVKTKISYKLFKNDKSISYAMFRDQLAKNFGI